MGGQQAEDLQQRKETLKLINNRQKENSTQFKITKRDYEVDIS